MVPPIDRLTVAGLRCLGRRAGARLLGLIDVDVTWSEIVTFGGAAGVKATWIESWSAFCTCVAVMALDWCCAAACCASIEKGFCGNDKGRVVSMPRCLRSPPFLS